MSSLGVIVYFLFLCACAINATTPGVHHLQPPTNLATEVQQLKAMVQQLNASLTQATLNAREYPFVPPKLEMSKNEKLSLSLLVRRSVVSLYSSVISFRYFLGHGVN